MSRNLLPFFLLLGVTCLVYAYESRRRKWLIPLSLAFLAISFYAYAASVLVIPSLIVLYAILNWRTVWQYKCSFLLSLAVFLVLAFPFLLFLLDNYVLHSTPGCVQHPPFTVPLLISRLEQVSSGDVLVNNLRFVARGFNDDILWKSMPWYAPLGVLTIPLACIGQALTHATGAATPGESIYIYIHINALHRANVTLFFLQADAQDFQRHAQIRIVDGTSRVESYRNFYFVYQPVLVTAPSYIAILRGSEQVHCASTQLPYKEPGWTVERRFNPSS